MIVQFVPGASFLVTRKLSCILYTMYKCTALFIFLLGEPGGGKRRGLFVSVIDRSILNVMPSLNV